MRKIIKIITLSGMCLFLTGCSFGQVDNESEMQAMEASYNQKINDLDSSYKSKIEEIDSSYQSEIDDLNSSYKSKIEGMDSSYKSDIDDLNGKISELEQITTYSVTFDCNGGTLPTNCQSSISVEENKCVDNLPIPTYADREFLGWFADFTINDSQWTNTSIVTKDINLIAKWSYYEITYSYYDYENNQKLSEKVTVEDGKIPEEKVPSDKEVNSYLYSFLYWKDNKGNTFDYNTEIHHDYYLTPEYSSTGDAIMFTVTFDYNNGSNSTDVSVLKNNNVDKPADPVKEESTFLGWYLNNEEFDFNTNITSSITLIAHYIGNDCNLKINYLFADGSEAAESNCSIVQYDTEYSVSSPAIDGYSASISVVTGTMKGDKEINVYYSFKSWNISYSSNDDVWCLLNKDAENSGYYKLSIVGSGKMKDFIRNDTILNWVYAPWYSNYNTYINEITIDSNITNISNNAFREMSSLTTVNLKENSAITEIGDYAFYACGNLKCDFLIDNITSIGSYAFSKTGAISKLVLPEALTSIGTYAYEYTNINTLVIGTNLRQVEWSVFNVSYFDTLIIMPNNCLSHLGFYNVYPSSIYYGGTISDWANIILEYEYWIADTSRYYYSEEQPTSVGNYWHLVDGEPVIWDSVIE